MALTPRQQAWQKELDANGQKVFEADLVGEWAAMLLLPIGCIIFLFQMIDRGLTGMFIVVLIFGLVMSAAYALTSYSRIRAYRGTTFVVDYDGLTTWDGVFVPYTDIAEVRPRSTWKDGGFLQIALTDSAAKRFSQAKGNRGPRVLKSPIGLNFGPSIWAHDFFGEGLLTRRIFNRPHISLGEWFLYVSKQERA